MQALILEQQDGKTVASVQAIEENRLPEGDVTVDIDWSSLNFKDALAITGKGKIIRNFPMVPGIDFAGRVHTSEDPRFHAGQQVLLTGWGVGENHWGGLAAQARVKGDWLVPMPKGLDGRKAMIIGTAGFTAVSGRESTHDYLRQLGASRILSRDEFAETRPLEKQVWAGAVDTVGDNVLAKVLAQMNYGGCVAACGLAGGFALPTTVMPFILRNVRLQGVDSVMSPAERRAEAWERLVQDLPASFYEQSATEITLSQAPEFANKIMDNQFHGRALVKIA
ncbi:MDR family oxidoreductase [Enterobacter hormaechei]|uniref:MDR family oxidoreductase n=1 Tax=Enterobacter hormaechei TaxID=158836 RepID=UPI0013FDC6E6|nr:MDR family oxidoreductase [Enterobacter hormaechei]